MNEIIKMEPMERLVLKNARGDIIGTQPVDLNKTIDDLIVVINSIADAMNTMNETVELIVEFLDVDKKKVDEL